MHRFVNCMIHRLCNLSQVLAHRGSHWTTLQTVCQTVWDQSCRMAFFVQRAAELESPCVITTDQLQTVFMPLLMLATDLLMDMLNRLGVSVIYLHYMHTVA